jgi:hypothetical protein
MKGIESYKREEIYPKILPVDFENIKTFNWHSAISREGLKEVHTEYSSEDVYQKFTSELLDCEPPKSNQVLE